MKHTQLFPVLTAGLVAALTAAAFAQSNPAASSPLSSLFNQLAQQAESGKPAPNNVTPVSDKLLTYKPSSKVSAEVRNLFIGKLIEQGKHNGTLTPALEKQVRDSFSKVDISSEYQKLLKPKGYDVYNVVTAMTLYVVSAFEVLDGFTSSDAVDQATFDQFKKAFGGVKAVQSMSDADKQKFAEALLWLTAFQANDLEQAKKGTKGYTFEKVKAEIKDSLLGFKLDPSKVRVGDNGLQARE